MRRANFTASLQGATCREKDECMQCRKALRTTVSSVRYLCRAGQALQGQMKDEGNFLDLLDERSQDVPALKKWLEQQDRWLSSDIQNKLIEIKAQCSAGHHKRCQVQSIL